MINFGSVEGLKTKVQYLQKQIEMMAGWIPKCNLVLDKSADPEKEKEKIIEMLQGHREKVMGVYEEVSGLDTREEMERISLGIQLEKLKKIDNIILKVKRDVEHIVHTHYTARLDPYLREVARALNDVYRDFKFMLPNLRYEMEIMETHFRKPGNAEKSIMGELQESIVQLEKHHISFEQFLNGFVLNKKNYQGFKKLRTVDSVFSHFQYYENLAEKYDEINGVIYNLCKILDPFFREHKHEEEFMEFATKFADITSRTVTKKSVLRKRKNIICMTDVFDLYNTFSKIIKKMGVRYSFLGEYTKSVEEFKNYEALIDGLIVYDTEAFDKTVKVMTLTVTSDSEKAKMKQIVDEMRDNIKKKTLPFVKIESIFQQLKKKDFHVVVVERDVDEMTVQITAHLEEKYGLDTLKRINLIIEEVDYWMYGVEKQEKFSMISPFTDKMTKGKDVDINDLSAIVKEFDEEMKSRFRNGYVDYVMDLARVTGSLEKMFSSKQGRKQLSARLVEKEPWTTYIPKLLNAKKGVLIASGFIKKTDGAQVNLFPFIKLAGIDLSLILYELSMRLFSLYERADKLSVTNMLNIQLLYREYRDVRSQWQSFSIFFKMANALNFDVMEDRIKSLPENVLIKKELVTMFPEKKPSE